MSHTVTVAGEAVRIEPVSARKASRAFALLRHINRRAKDLAKSVDRFEREWRDEHVTMLTRPEARVQFPALLILDPETGTPVKDPDTSELIYRPSPVDTMSETDWQATDGRYPVHERAPGYAVAMHAFDDAVEVAEAHVYRLLALLLMPNDEVSRRHREGTLDDELDQAANDLLDTAMADEVFELAVVCAEVLDEQFNTKMDELGDRAGNAMRLLGMGKRTTSSSSTTPPSGPTTSTPDSSTDTPSSNGQAGHPTPSSTPTTDSSSESAPSPTEPEQPPTPELQGSE